MVRRRDGRVLRRGLRDAPAGRRPRPGRGDPAAGDDLARAGAGAPRGDADGPAPPGGAPARPRRVAGGGGGRRGARRGVVARAGVAPGVDRLLAHGARAVFRPERGRRLSARSVPEARDLVRHAFADVGGNANLARSWAAFARRWPSEPWRDLLDKYRDIEVPVLLLWADEDHLHPLLGAEEALDLLPDGQLRVLSGTGYLLAYDDPVGVARELAAFCG